MFGIGIAAAIIVVALIAIFGAATSRYKKVGPDEALVISGRGRTITEADGTKRKVGFRVVRNGGAIVIPIVEKVGRLSLSQMQTKPATQNALSKDGVPIHVVAIALLKIASDEAGIMAAAERFLDVKPDGIERAVNPVLESHLRSVCGTMTPEEIYSDREAFQRRIAEHAQTDLARIGIVLDILTLHDISDEKGYLNAIGETRTAQVLRDARMGKAMADQEATVREAEARNISQTAMAQAEANIAEAKRNRDVSIAQFDAMVAAERAKADQSGPRADAEAKQAVVEAETILAQKQAELKQRELLSTVVKPAEAKRDALIAEAEGEKAARTLRAEAEQVERTQEGLGEAAKIRNVGQAEGDALRAKGEGEAAGISARAKAMKEFNDAAMGLQIATELIRILPEIIKAAAGPVGAINRLDIMDFGGSHSGDSAGGGPIAKLLDIPPQAIAAADATLKATLGRGLAEMIQLVRSGKIDEALTAGQGREGLVPGEQK